MKFLKVLPLLFSIIALGLSLYSLKLAPQITIDKNVSSEEEFTSKFINLVRCCINYSKDIRDKNPILELIDEIERKSLILEEGNDDLRIKFVHSQGCIEHVLACCQALGEIDELIGVIHTPLPATPLCTLPSSQEAENLLDDSIRYDPDKLLTVCSRAKIIREYLVKGGILYIVYPKGGLEKRNLEQQKIYLTELDRFPEQLIDWTLSCTEMDPQKVGATYLFRNSQGTLFSFSIKATQANNPQSNHEWGMWFGPIKEPVITNRLNQIFDYLKQNNGPDIRPSQL